MTLMGGAGITYGGGGHGNRNPAPEPKRSSRGTVLRDSFDGWGAPDIDLRERVLSQDDLNRAKWEDRYGKPNLRGSDFGDATMEGLDLRNADLSGTYFVGTNLEGARLRFADLRGATMRHADLRGADLRNSQGVSGKGTLDSWYEPADLRNAHLYYEDLRDLPLKPDAAFEAWLEQNDDEGFELGASGVTSLLVARDVIKERHNELYPRSGPFRRRNYDSVRQGGPLPYTPVHPETFALTRAYYHSRLNRDELEERLNPGIGRANELAPDPPVVQDPPAKASEPIIEQPRKKPVFAKQGFEGSMYDDRRGVKRSEQKESAIKKSRRSVGRRRRGSF